MKKTIFLLSLIFFLSAFFFFCYENNSEKAKNEYDQTLELSWKRFLNNQNDNFLYYKYYPFKKEFYEWSHALREMWALMSIIELKNYLKTKGEEYKNISTELDSLWKKWIHYFSSYLTYEQEGDFYYIDITPSKIKLWYNGFMIIAMVEDNYLDMTILEKLANWILHQQQDNWEFKTFFFSDRATWVDYYPWEAMLWLMYLYEVDKNQEYIDSVKRGFYFYRDYWRNDKNMAFVPWQTKAYSKFYNLVDDKEISDFIFEMNDYIIEKYSKNDNCNDFNFDMNWMTTSVYIEWLNYAYDVAEKIWDIDRMKCYSNFIKQGISYISDLQIKEIPFYLEEYSLWGFLWNKNSNDTRVDRNQHGTSAIIYSIERWLTK